MSRLRELIETELFRRQLESFAQTLGGAELLDEALNAISWALARKPEACPVIPNTNALRVIKTYEYKRSGLTIPPLKVWFTIRDENTVLLLAITRQDIKESDDLDF